MIKFTERRQLPKESISEFFNAVQELAHAAHPKMEKRHRDDIAREQFINGLRNRAVKNEIRLKRSNNDQIDSLAEAIDLNKTLPIEDDNDLFTCHHIHTPYSQNDSQSPQRQQPYQPHQSPNHNHDYNQRLNREQQHNKEPPCKKCSQLDHEAHDCMFQQPMHNENGANIGTQQQGNAQGNQEAGSVNDLNARNGHDFV
jgi:hypothetical protein